MNPLVLAPQPPVQVSVTGDRNEFIRLTTVEPTAP